MVPKFVFTSWGRIECSSLGNLNDDLWHNGIWTVITVYKFWFSGRTYSTEERSIILSPGELFRKVLACLFWHLEILCFLFTPWRVWRNFNYKQPTGHKMEACKSGKSSLFNIVFKALISDMKGIFWSRCISPLCQVFNFTKTADEKSYANRELFSLTETGTLLSTTLNFF